MTLLETDIPSYYSPSDSSPPGGDYASYGREKFEVSKLIVRKLQALSAP
jgi:hypothetical protein